MSDKLEKLLSDAREVEPEPSLRQTIKRSIRAEKRLGLIEQYMLLPSVALAGLLSIVFVALVVIQVRNSPFPELLMMSIENVDLLGSAGLGESALATLEYAPIDAVLMAALSATGFLGLLLLFVSRTRVTRRWTTHGS